MKITVNGTEIRLTYYQVKKIRGSAYKNENPKIGEKYLVVHKDNTIKDLVWNNDSVDHGYLRAKNCFFGKDKWNKAEMERLRRESMANAWIPKDSEDVWIWSFSNKKLFNPLFDCKYISCAILGMCHKTKEECEEWGEKYAPAFLDKLQ